MARNRKLIKQQNIAAKSGRYISLAQAKEQLSKAEEDSKKEKLSNKAK